MGIEKNAMIEAEDRRWRIPEGYVCPDCVEDEYLKYIICDNACCRECDYCGRRTRKHSAAPIAEIMEAIGNTVFTWFDNPEEAEGFWDSEDNNYFGVIDAIDTSEMLGSIQLECKKQLFEDIAESFVNDQWVETANGSIYGSHPDELMSYAWERFTEIVKNESRYFFQQTSSTIENDEDEYQFAQQENYNPANFLPTLGKLAIKLKLLATLPINETLFRARLKKEGEFFDLNSKELGSALKKASAGRMNPAGISYMYLAFDQETALAEVRRGNQLSETAIGRFETQRELQVLDLANLPTKPSIFNVQCYDELVGLFFIDKFVKEIAKPIVKDGSEHIEYVPSQVVSEYFALVFCLQNGRRLDGIKYPSAVREGCHNLVLFPSERGSESMFDQVEFQQGWWASPP